ncbi:hypothetical protein H9P43_009146 [Blastocladiella emersonii ATCC 22665]|nr:hypothetical protein H9P43_009146 [Blastocladiella emersonii ATCC 22665]
MDSSPKFIPTQTSATVLYKCPPKHFDPFRDTYATDVFLYHDASKPDRKLSALLCGFNDLRSVAHTLGEAERKGSRAAMSFTLNDLRPEPIARSLLILHALMYSTFDRAALEILLAQVWLSEHLQGLTLEFWQDRLHDCLDFDWTSPTSPHRKALLGTPAFTHSRITDVIDELHDDCEGDCTCEDDLGPLRKVLAAQATYAVTFDHPEMLRASRAASVRCEVERHIENGAFFETSGRHYSESEGPKSIVNPTFIAEEGESPEILSVAVSGIFFNAAMGSIQRSLVLELQTWLRALSDAFDPDAVDASRQVDLTFVIGDAVLVMEQFLADPAQRFDVVDTSTLMHRCGALNLVLHGSHLLKHNHATAGDKSLLRLCANKLVGVDLEDTAEVIDALFQLPPLAFPPLFGVAIREELGGPFSHWLAHVRPFAPNGRGSSGVMQYHDVTFVKLETPDVPISVLASEPLLSLVTELRSVFARTHGFGPSVAAIQGYDRVLRASATFEIVDWHDLDVCCIRVAMETDKTRWPDAVKLTDDELADELGTLVLALPRGRNKVTAKLVPDRDLAQYRGAVALQVDNRVHTFRLPYSARAIRVEVDHKSRTVAVAVRKLAHAIAPELGLGLLVPRLAPFPVPDGDQPVSAFLHGVALETINGMCTLKEWPLGSTAVELNGLAPPAAAPGEWNATALKLLIMKVFDYAAQMDGACAIKLHAIDAAHGAPTGARSVPGSTRGVIALIFVHRPVVIPPQGKSLWLTPALDVSYLYVPPLPPKSASAAARANVLRLRKLIDLTENAYRKATSGRMFPVIKWMGEHADVTGEYLEFCHAATTDHAIPADINRFPMTKPGTEKYAAATAASFGVLKPELKRALLLPIAHETTSQGVLAFKKNFGLLECSAIVADSVGSSSDWTPLLHTSAPGSGTVILAINFDASTTPEEYRCKVEELCNLERVRAMANGVHAAREAAARQATPVKRAASSPPVSLSAKRARLASQDADGEQLVLFPAPSVGASSAASRRDATTAAVVGNGSESESETDLFASDSESDDVCKSAPKRAPEQIPDADTDTDSDWYHVLRLLGIADPMGAEPVWYTYGARLLFVLDRLRGNDEALKSIASYLNDCAVDEGIQNMFKERCTASSYNSLAIAVLHGHARAANSPMMRKFHAHGLQLHS